MVMNSISKKIVVTGPNIIKRVDAEFAVKLREKNIEIIYYTPDGIFGQTKHELRNIKAPSIFPLRLIKYFKLLLKENPDHVEMYIDFPTRNLVFYALFARLLGKKLIIWCRGGEILYWETRHTIYRRTVIRICFALAGYFFVKESYMRSKMLYYKLAKNKQIIWLPNKIPVFSGCEYAKAEPVVLFLNSPKTWRHIEIVAEAIPHVINKIPEAKFYFVGARNQEELNYINNVIEMYFPLGDSVQNVLFSADARLYYEKASIFVLPAELIYANHSLLEAMERGVPPIIANIDQKGKDIITHGENGLVLPLDWKQWSEAIINLLSNEELRTYLGKNARMKIMTNFNIQDKIDDLVSFYNENIW
jgi:glycosyltransferase involved in cell wall biosynthesis